MALQAYDGFDNYSAESDLTTRSGFLQWQVVSLGLGIISFVPGPNGFGKAVKVLDQSALGPEIGLRAVWGARNSEAFVAQRLLIPAALTGFPCIAVVEIFDGVAGLPQLSIIFNGNNFSIQVCRGTTSGPLLASSPNNIWSPDTWFFAEIHPVIANSGGSIDILIKGVSVFGGPVTGLDTQATSNAWFDTTDYYPGPIGNIGNSFIYIDDVRYNDTSSGPGPNPYDSYMGDMRTITRFAIGNSSVQFTPAITSAPIGSVAVGATVPNAANTISCAPFQSTYAGVMGSAIQVDLNASVTGHVVLGLYDSDGLDGTPGTKLAQSSAITNPTSGVNTFTLGSTPTMITGHTYYWAISSDATATIDCATGTGSTWYTIASAYSSTMPSSMASTALPTTSAHGVAAVSGVLTLSNAGNVSEVAMDSDATYNSDATLNNQDLLNFRALPLLIDNIAAIQLTIAARKDEAGARDIAAALKVTSTTYYSGNFPLNLTYNYYSYIWILNPDTTLPWAVPDVNGLAGGYKITV